MAVYKIKVCQWNCYPDTTVLINKLDIRNQAELDAVEKQITLLRGTQAEQGTEFVNVDFEFYKSLHKTLFGDLYNCAGRSDDAERCFGRYNRISITYASQWEALLIYCIVKISKISCEMYSKYSSKIILSQSLHE